MCTANGYIGGLFVDYNNVFLGLVLLSYTPEWIIPVTVVPWALLTMTIGFLLIYFLFVKGNVCTESLFVTNFETSIQISTNPTVPNAKLLVSYIAVVIVIIQ